MLTNSVYILKLKLKLNIEAIEATEYIELESKDLKYCLKTVLYVNVYYIYSIDSKLS